jgi:pimeloyl-ACP methyl ester carboxylesterase
MQLRHYAGFGGVSLAADVGGEPSRPPVILMHGGGQTRHAWGRAARELIAEGYHVICPDARGHGDSGWAEDGNYRLDAFSADLRAIIGTLTQRPALIGASLGGGTALLTIGESETPIASALVLVDMVPRPDPVGVSNIVRFMGANPQGFASLEEAADAVTAYNPHRPRARDHSGLMKNLRQRADGRFYWHWDPKFLAPAHRLNPQDYQERMDAATARIRVPTLLVRGAMSDIVTAEAAAELQRTIPGCEVVDVAGAGHMVAGDRNDVFNAAISGFLKRHSAREARAVL